MVRGKSMDWLLNNLRLRLFTWFKVPLIAYLGPVVERLDDRRCVLRIPLRRRSRNHLASMYLGALTTGAETTVGVVAFSRIQKRGLRVSVVQRAFTAEFHARATGDVHFVCDEVEVVHGLLDQAAATSDRVEGLVRVRALVPDQRGDDPVADFTFTLSVRSKR